MNKNQILDSLYAAVDAVYRDFNSSLLPTVDKVRFAVLCLMRYFLNSGFDAKYADMVLNIKSDEYYVNMMRAWYFATAAAKHFKEALPYFDRLDSWIRIRAIQKAIESYRVSAQNKLVLKSLRQKDAK